MVSHTKQIRLGKKNYNYSSDLDLTSGYIFTASRNQIKSTNGFTCRTGSTSTTRRDRRTEINLGLTS